MDELEFTRAPRENLQTWGRLKSMIVWSSVAIAIVLLIMAAALTP